MVVYLRKGQIRANLMQSAVTLCKSGKSGFGLVSVKLSQVKSGECSQNGI